MLAESDIVFALGVFLAVFFEYVARFPRRWRIVFVPLAGRLAKKMTQTSSIGNEENQWTGQSLPPTVDRWLDGVLGHVGRGPSVFLRAGGEH